MLPSKYKKIQVAKRVYFIITETELHYVLDVTKIITKSYQRDEITSLTFYPPSHSVNPGCLLFSIIGILFEDVAMTPETQYREPTLVLTLKDERTIELVNEHFTEEVAEKLQWHLNDKLL